MADAKRSRSRRPRRRRQGGKAPQGGKQRPARPRAARRRAAPATPASARTVTGDVPPRMRDRFRTAVIPALMKERGYTNPFQVPRLEKIVINMGVGEGKENAKVLDFAVADLAGDHGPEARGDAGEEVDRQLQAPRELADRLQGDAARGRACTSSSTGSSTSRCRGCGTSRACRPRRFDGRGNYNLGLKEQMIFPEIVYDKVDKVRGMDITWSRRPGPTRRRRRCWRTSACPSGSPRAWRRPRSS